MQPCGLNECADKRVSMGVPQLGNQGKGGGKPEPPLYNGVQILSYNGRCVKFENCGGGVEHFIDPQSSLRQAIKLWPIWNPPC